MSGTTAIVIATLAGGAVVALATIAASGYATWRQQSREVAFELNFDLLPRLDRNLGQLLRQEAELDLDLVGEVGRKASVFGGRMRKYADELFDYVSMWKHPTDGTYKARYPQHYSFDERGHRDWIAGQIKHVRDLISYRVYFDIQPLRHRVWGMWRELTRRRKINESDRAHQQARKTWVQI